MLLQVSVTDQSEDILAFQPTQKAQWFKKNPTYILYLYSVHLYLNFLDKHQNAIETFWVIFKHSVLQWSLKRSHFIGLQIFGDQCCRRSLSGRCRGHRAKWNYYFNIYFPFWLSSTSLRLCNFLVKKFLHKESALDQKDSLAFLEKPTGNGPKWCFSSSTP